jgi:hypothetical protein
MTEKSWPFYDGATGTPVLEDQWSIMARQWGGDGVVGAPNDAALQVWANGSGREVHVRVGRGCVRGHWYELDTADLTLNVAANTSGSPRIDRVVLRLDPSADSIVLAVKQGTPAGVPVAPTPTTTDVGVYEISLARVAVANGAASISAGNVTDERTHIGTPISSAGGAFTGPLAMGGNEISGLGNGVNAGDAATKAQVDAANTTGANAQITANNAQTSANNANTNANGRVSKSGDTVTGALTVNGGIYTDNVMHVRGAELVNSQKFYTNRDAMPTANGPGGINIIDFRFACVPKAGGAVQQVQGYDGLTIRDLMITYSTRRVKKDIGRASDTPDVTKLQPSSFRWKIDAPMPFGSERDRPQLGLIAEQVAEVDERLVLHGEDGEPTALNTGALIAALIAKVTELQDRIESLEGRRQ